MQVAKPISYLINTKPIIELWKEHQESGFTRRTINLVQDSVGYGFVVRGEGPSYVQTVDPTGPAAAGGLQVGQLVLSVNGRDVRTMNHREIARLIIASRQSAVRLVVLEPRETLQTGQ